MSVQFPGSYAVGGQRSKKEKASKSRKKKCPFLDTEAVDEDGDYEMDDTDDDESIPDSFVADGNESDVEAPCGMNLDVVFGSGPLSPFHSDDMCGEDGNMAEHSRAGIELTESTRSCFACVK